MNQQMGMAKQMMDMQKATFETMVNNMIMFWNQTESMFGPFLQQAPWIPEEGKKAFREWIDSNKKACETFKSTVNEGYSKLESYFAGSGM